VVARACRTGSYEPASGEVVVIAGGSKDLASFGDFSATVLLSRSAAGAVIDGATRDVDGITRLGLPVFAPEVCKRR
jgi:regulator of RNase E activity RraA